MRDILAELLAKRVRADIVMRIVQALEMADKFTGRREKDRIRKRLVRGIPRTSADTLNSSIKSNGASAEFRGQTDARHTYLREEEISKKEATGNEESKKGTSVEKGRRLPSDWQPRQAEIDEGLKLGWTLESIREKAEDMRVWAGANSNRQIARKANWNLTFRGMLRRDKPKQSKPTAPIRPDFRQAPPGHESYEQHFERMEREARNAKAKRT